MGASFLQAEQFDRFRFVAELIGGGILGIVVVGLLLYAIFRGFVAWLEHPKKGNGNGDSGQAGEKTASYWTGILDRIITDANAPVLKALEELRNELQSHHEYITQRHENLALALQQVTLVNSQSAELLKELTRSVQMMNTEQQRFFTNLRLALLRAPGFPET